MGQTQRVGSKATVIGQDEHGATYVQYHATRVVTWDNHTINLNTGGWKSHTTKTRMNQASNQFGLGYQVFQKDFEWFVQYRDCVIPFDGNFATLERD